jgi:hypothetical protein
MQKNAIVFVIMLLMLSLPYAVISQSVEILGDDEIEIMVGDSIMMMAEYEDEFDVKIDTTFTWSLVPDTLGYFNSDDYFVATDSGMGFIYAHLDTLYDSVKVHVKYEDDMDMPGYLVLMPKDTIVQVGHTVQYSAHFVDTSGADHDTSVAWDINGNPIGSLSGDGLFFAMFPGKSVIKAKLDTHSVSTKVFAVDTLSDSTGINTVHISRVLPDGKVLPSKMVQEGESYKIGGIPSPYNMINGGQVYFPMGSLKEDITLHIKLPSCIKVWDDSLEMKHKIINGIRFEVIVGDSVQKPYYFERPLHVSIPYKKGLVKKYGLKPEQLSMYFMTDSVTYDTIGISNVHIDSLANRIFAMVEHFSTLVIKQNPDISTSVSENNVSEAVPDQFELLQNYPNPFNPITTIEFRLSEASNVTVSIFTITGQQLVTLVSGKYDAGTHRVQWDASGVASGLYFYRVETNNMAQIKKMILLR